MTYSIRYSSNKKRGLGHILAFVTNRLLAKRYLSNDEVELFKAYLTKVFHRMYTTAHIIDSRQVVATVNFKKRDMDTDQVIINYSPVHQAPSTLTANLKFFKKNVCVYEATYPMHETQEDFFGADVARRLNDEDPPDIQKYDIPAHGGSLADPTVCSFCGCTDKTKKKKTCSQCKVYYYCDAVCQKKHWKHHKHNCKRF